MFNVNLRQFFAQQLFALSMIVILTAVTIAVLRHVDVPLPWHSLHFGINLEGLQRAGSHRPDSGEGTATPVLLRPSQENRECLSYSRFLSFGDTLIDAITYTGC